MLTHDNIMSFTIIRSAFIVLALINENRGQYLLKISKHKYKKKWPMTVA